ncbi:MAG: alpha-mannosidase [Lachnospiraceae bacterium]|nr:alpha-mannosidase [Lachnospiraceae bacterium]
MWFLDKRIQVICNELKRLSIVSREPVSPLHFKEGQYFTPEEAESADGSYRNTMAGRVNHTGNPRYSTMSGERRAPVEFSEPYLAGGWREFRPMEMKWYGPDQHYWFRADYTVPEKFAGKTLRFFVKTQIEETDDGKNPQFLLFVNGAVTQGMDMNHRTAQMTDSAIPGETWRLDLQAYTGTLHAEFDMIAEMLEVDPRIEKLYYDLQVPLQAFSRMEKDDQNRIQIERILNDAVNRIDLRTPYSDAFYQSVQEAEEVLERDLYTGMAGYEDVVATCIGHTHIDIGWWWTVEQVREKTARSFSTVLKLMDEYPDYKFMSSQPQLYQFLKERYPETYARIKERVKEGRWEAEGGMWLEADTNLTSGESLVRQFLYGKRFFREEFDVDCKILWLPDVFGYSGALPQIMKKSGIDYFMTTKLAWNQVDRVPYDTFRWRGIDGSEVLTHLITTTNPGQDPEKDFFTTYNGVLHPDPIMGGWKRYQNKDINNDILISFGYGDGGGGPTREMLETSRRMEKGIRGIPKVRQETARTYFDELNERVKDNPRLPVWEGELYFEFHRGTYTSMARNKRSNRKSEFLMMDLELLTVLSGLPTEKERMDAFWTKILLNQFHDVLPGTAIHEVYEVTRQEYQWLTEEAGEMLEHRLAAVAGTGDAVTLFNTLSFARYDVVRLPLAENTDSGMTGLALQDEEGALYPMQRIGNEQLAYVKNLPSKGFCSYRIARTGTGAQPKLPFTLRGNCLETPFYLIRLDNTGCFASIYDKENDREVLQEGKPGNLFRMYEDKPNRYDNWDIDIYYTEKSWDVTGLTYMEWISIGPVCAVLEIERPISNSLIRQKIYFYADIRRIDFETWVDWKDHQHLLKVHFPLAVHTDEATFDIQFGNLTRKVHTNTSWDMARFESCGQKWIDLSEGHYGVSLLNDCKYGHSVKDSVIGLTLIKSGTLPNPVTDQEEHVFTYSLYPHAGNLRECDTVRQGYCLNLPILAKTGSAMRAPGSLLSVDKRNVIVETVKTAEDGNGIILRVYEYENALTKATVTFGMAKTVAKVQECNLLEESCGEPLAHSGNSFAFTIRPYEIKSYRVLFAEK